jgi:hypothetical protein
MAISFDPRIIGPAELSFLQACQARVPFHLGGGAALAGVHLRHRLSADADLFLHSKEAHRERVRLLSEIAAATGVAVTVVRDAGAFVRARLVLPKRSIELDLNKERYRARFEKLVAAQRFGGQVS